MIGVIYSLSTGGNNIFYVGITFNDIKHRLSAHLAESLRDGGNIRKNEILEENRDCVIIEPIEEFDLDESDALSLEHYWINQFYQWGFNLVNIIGLPGRRIKKEKIKLKQVMIPESLYNVLSLNCEPSGMFISTFVKIAVMERVKKIFNVDVF